MSAARYELLDDSRGPKAAFATDVGTLVLRVTVSLMVIHHGLQKLQNPEAFAANMVEKFFPFLPWPLLWTWLAIVVELAGSLCLGLGVFSRVASFLLFFTVGVFANLFHFDVTGVQEFPFGVPAGGAYAFEPSLLSGAIFFYFMCAGPGKYALRPNLF